VLVSTEAWKEPKQLPPLIDRFGEFGRFHWDERRESEVRRSLARALARIKEERRARAKLLAKVKK
jgi:hypothetical protein